VLSFDSALSRHGFVEISGSTATLAMPDPNRFDGDIRVHKVARKNWTAVPASGATDGRGLGVLDLARGLRSGAPHRANGEVALHVLEVLEAIDRSATTGAFEPVRTSFTRPAALPEDWDPHAGTLA
jgi:predicted dehydrogenase